MKKQKTKLIIVRGCVFRVKIELAKELEKVEKKMSEKDWNKNLVD